MTTVVNPYLSLIYPQNKRSRLKTNSIASFYDFQADYFHGLLSRKSPDFWQRAGENMALELFRLASKRVPAYKNFLRKNGVNPSSIKSIKDFQSLPITSKENYLKKYSLRELCWDGKLERNSLLSVSSGSSGIPFFWPRGNNLELETSISHEMFLKYIFGADKKDTLFINTFSMGIYIAGVITLNSLLRVAQKNYPITIINPGINQEEILRILKDVTPLFSQVIISGYPPFVKDILDICHKSKIDLASRKFKFLFATESISEGFRDYIFKSVSGDDILSFALNIYGSADAGILGHETPLSIFIKRSAKLAAPTFVQYNPVFKYYEEKEEKLIFSAFGGIPLIRYEINDFGKVHSYEEGIGFLSPAQQSHLPKTHWKLPFLSVEGKRDKAVSLYGVKVYPEHIKAGIEKEGFRNLITGKFVLEKSYNSRQDQYIKIHFELKKGVETSAALRQSIKRGVINSLKENNLEYNRLYQSIGQKADPKIIFWPNGYQKYFNPKSIKHRWVIR